MHDLSKIKTASNGTTNYFDLKLQMSDDKSVRLVCFSPPKRKVLQTAYEKRSPVKIEANLNTRKRLYSDSEEYTVPKNAKIMPTELQFNFNEDLDNHLHVVNEALKANIYTSVDLKVKVIIKEENKNPIVQDTKTRYKCDTLVADVTGCAKLVLWEDMINKVARGKCYHFKNITVRIFDDEKYLNTNESTTVEEIDDIQNVNIDAPEIKNNLLKVKVVGVNIKKSPSCLACNHTFPTKEEPAPDEEITRTNCSITTLTSFCNTKLVAQIIVKTTKELATYTCFKDGIESFLKNVKCAKSLTEIEPAELKQLLLKSGEQTIIVDKKAKIIAQFLPASDQK